MWPLAFFLFFSQFAIAAPGPDSSAWRALLHYEGNRSNAKAGAPLFLSPKGHEDAAAEYEATRALLSTSEGRCRFPARALFFGLQAPAEGPLCERYQRWREAISPEGVELVFAAAFLNSPSSMYGHTLLKFRRSGKTAGEELLDYTLNYGADTGSTTGASYVWQGLTGGFSGRYATAPFYLKVKEYNFVENRDFWVYPLKLAPEELELLVAHAWELRDVDFPYYFLRKNCSYYLLEFLEVARPGTGLAKSFPLWAVPMDTIRRLSENGWLGDARLRPSRQKILRARKEKLNHEEIETAALLARGELPEGGAGLGAPVLDAAYDLWRFKHESKAVSVQERQVETGLLEARGKVATRSESPEILEKPPHLGHPTNRISLAAGHSRAYAFTEFTYRGTLHDILADPLGFEPASELSMGDIRFRFENKKLYAERVDVLRLRSLAPHEAWFPRYAWSFRAGLGRAKEMPCKDWRCATGILSGGQGLSLQLGPLLVFALGEIDAEVGAAFAKRYRLGMGPSAGVFTRLWPNARLLLEGDYRFRILGEKRQRRSARASISQTISRRWEMRAESSVDRGAREASIAAYFYF